MEASSKYNLSNLDQKKKSHALRSIPSLIYTFREQGSSPSPVRVS